MVTAMDEKMYEVLKKVFKHKDFKSDLQKRVVKCVLEGMYFCTAAPQSPTELLIAVLYVHYPPFFPYHNLSL